MMMAPLRSIKFQTANFPIFCACIIAIFCTTFIAREVFSLAIMGSDIVLWLEVKVSIYLRFMLDEVFKYSWIVFKYQVQYLVFK